MSYGQVTDENGKKVIAKQEKDGSITKLGSPVKFTKDSGKK